MWYSCNNYGKTIRLRGTIVNIVSFFEYDRQMLYLYDIMIKG